MGLLGYKEFLSTRSDLLFFYIVLGLLFVFNVTRFSSFNEAVMFIIVMASLGFMLYSYTLDPFSKWRDTYTNFKEDAEDIANNGAMPYESIFESNYEVHRMPNKFKYTLNHENALKIVESIKFLKRFDDSSYKRILMLLEGFFKKYDRILNSRTDSCVQHLAIMQDIRADLLNELARSTFGVPERYAFQIQQAVKQMQTMTYKCTKVASRRCEKLTGVTMLTHRPPYAADFTNPSQHNLF